VHRYELAHTSCRSRAGIRRRLDSSDVASDENRHISGSDVLLADEYDVGRFDHRVGGLN
jgi:hypothetical protein